MYFTNFLFALVLIFSTSQIYATAFIKGTIKDADTNDFLIEANIYIENTYNGTISNNEGEYLMRIEELPAVMVISYIGYETQNITITNPGIQELYIHLKPASLQLEKIVFISDGRDPAYEIMEKVIEQKKLQQKKLKSFKGKAYTRETVANDTAIVSISESVSDLFWDCEKGFSEEIKSIKSSKSLSYLTKDVAAKDIVNLTDDNISIMSYDFIGVTHPDAFSYYDFKLIKQKQLDDKIVFEIEVIPDSKLQPLFEGVISVIDQNFAILYADLNISKNVKFPTYIKKFKRNSRQHFSNFGGEFWLPIDSDIETITAINFGIFLTMPEIHGKRISRISDYEINIDISNAFTRLDSLKNRESKKISTINVTAGPGGISASASMAGTKADQDKIAKNDENSLLKRDQEYKSVPLTAEEEEAYRTIDSTFFLLRKFKPSGGLLASILIEKDSLIEKQIQTSIDNPDSISRITENNFLIYPDLTYNRVEGGHLGANLSYFLNKNFTFSGMGNYQTGRKKMGYLGKLEYFPMERNQIRNSNGNKLFLFGTYYNLISKRLKSENYNEWITGVASIAGFDDYSDYFQKQGFEVGIAYHFWHKNNKLSFSFVSAKHNSVEKETDYNLFNKDFIQRSNPTIEEGKLNSFKLENRFTYSSNSMNLPDNSIYAEIEASPGNIIGSDFNFFKYSLSVDLSLPTFFKRRPDPNYVRAKIKYSGFAGALPVQKFNSLDGNICGYSPFGSFKTIANRMIEGESTFGVFIDYNFSSIPFEILRLDLLTKNKYELVFHGALGKSWIDKNRFNDLSFRPYTMNEFHYETGIGIVLKYMMFKGKFDITRNFNNNNTYFGFSLGIGF